MGQDTHSSLASLGGPVHPRAQIPSVGSVNSIRHQMEDGSTSRLDRRARNAGQHEHTATKRRNISPAAIPGLIWPGPPHGLEHVSSHDPGAHVLEAPRGEVIVHPAPC